jgi:hypothetical protein
LERLAVPAAIVAPVVWSEGTIWVGILKNNLNIFNF